MSKQDRNGRTIGMWLWIALVALLTACVGEELDGPAVGKGTGLLRLTIGEVDGTVRSGVGTKAESAKIDKLLPPSSQLQITISRGGTVVVDKPYGQLTDAIELAAGTYTVTASHGTNLDLQESPYVYASGEVIVTTATPADLTLKPALGNAMLEAQLMDKELKHYKTWTLSATVGTTNRTLLSSDQPQQVGRLFAKAGSAVTVSFEGTNVLDKKIKTQTAQIASAAAGTGYFINCNPDLSGFDQLRLTANAVHTKSQNGYLTGTDVTLSVENPKGVDLEAIEAWKVELTYNGSTIRTFTGKGDPNEKKMDVAANWPYVPKGATLTASFRLKEEAFTLAPTLQYSDLTVDAIVAGTTTYSLYKEGKVTEANQENGSSIWGMTTTPKIAAEIENNANYTSLLPSEYTYSVGGQAPTDGRFDNLPWGKQTLSATAQFDGYTVAGNVDCDVTGLPYRISFMDNAKPSGWDFNRNGKAFDRLVLKEGEAYALSPQFHVPGNIGVSTLLNAYAYGGSLPYKYQSTVSISASEQGVNSVVAATLKGDINYPSLATFYDVTSNVDLTTTVRRICIYTKGDKQSGSIAIDNDLGVVCDHFSAEYK